VNPIVTPEPGTPGPLNREPSDPGEPVDPTDYCRAIETYLTRKNEGHLIRIVGPAFEQVCGWAAMGVPLKVAFRGIDQYCDRYYARGPRRRPVRIEFCEGDILDLFDNWRRAVGVAAAAGVDPAGEAAPRKPALAAHIERVIARLATVRAAGNRSPGFDGAVDSSVRELERLAGDARRARGEQRTRIIERLADLDRALMDAAAREVDAPTSAALRLEAEAELAPFGSRMAPDARAQATTAAFERLLRESLGLPVVQL
jgi:hypothetical protein